MEEKFRIIHQAIWSILIAGRFLLTISFPSLRVSDISEKSEGFVRLCVEILLTLPNSLTMKLFLVGEGIGLVFVLRSERGWIIFFVKAVPKAGNLTF